MRPVPIPGKEGRGKVKKRLTALALALGLMLTTAAPGALALNIHGYQEGFAQAEEEGKWGFAGPDGSVVIPLQYDSVVSFSLGMAAVNLNGRLGVIRSDGKYLIQPKYDTLMPVGYGLYIAQEGDDWGVVSVLPYLDDTGRKTNEVYPLIYENVELGKSGGLDALTFTAKGGTRTIVPLFHIPGTLQRLGVGGSQFPLIRGRLPYFTDVGGRDWYSLWVDIAYNTGIISGTGNSTFAPGREVTVAEALQMAANMDSRYKGDTFHTTAHVSTPWYTEAVDYCLASGIIAPGQFDGYERQITRRELAQVFAATGLARSLPERNDIRRVTAAVGDVTQGDEGAQAIYGLYAKGILTGVDENLSFRPDDLVTRAEAAALAARLARPEQRVDLF